MISRSIFFVLALFAFPLGVYASVVNIDFSARITTTLGNGTGYQVGDLVSGTFVVDTSKADGLAAGTAT
jgi:hypothetical protein